MSAISASGGKRPGLQRQVGRGRAADRGAGPAGVAGAGEAEPAGGGEVEQPGGEHAVVDQPATRAGDALAVERARGEAARAQRVVGDGDAGAEHGLAQPVLEEAAAAGDRVAADGAGEMAQQPGGGAGRVDDRHPGGRDLARADPARGALPGLAADALGRGQVGAVGRLAILVVALHGRCRSRPAPWRRGRGGCAGRSRESRCWRRASPGRSTRRPRRRRNW